MTDGRDPLDGQLADWFASEVRRAERELADGTAEPVRVVRRRAVPVAALGALVLALIVGLVALRPPAPRTAAGGESALPSSSVAPAPSSFPPGVALGGDRLPDWIDGERVVRLPELRAALADDDRAIVAGWHAYVSMRCMAPPPDRPRHKLIPWCHPDRLMSDAEAPAAELLVTRLVPLPVGWVAVRVHVDDPAAATCPATFRRDCESAIVVDELLWVGRPDDVVTGSDGFPIEIEGQPVYRPRAAADLLADARDDTPILVVGRYHRSPRLCPLPDCGLDELSDEALGRSEPLDRDVTRIRVAPGAVRPKPGIVVIRVHVTNTTITCPSDPVCDPFVLVDEVLWREP